jgi:hypothetical protein
VGDLDDFSLGPALSKKLAVSPFSTNKLGMVVMTVFSAVWGDVNRIIKVQANLSKNARHYLRNK